ncbi:MAG TPA: DUF1587 domain-containing protein, partial [Gemmataceae bacterium]|nr:DUF1587 domain-containing protein [Gemmataceae bacterium]
MSRKSGVRGGLFVLAVGLTTLYAWCALRSAPAAAPQGSKGKEGTTTDQLERRFATRVQPFLARYCFSCHGPKKQEAALDLSRDATVKAIANNARQWELVLERLDAQEMPPKRAPQRPEPAERAEVIAWIRALRDHEAERNAGDPGTVLARRLSNAEFDYTIRDLTGVDIRPAREFPVDPANEAGFDNSGESLAMSPALLKKYLAATRLVADHVILKPEGFVFAPHPVVTDTDRDKYCVHRIIDFYDRHKVDFADYFLAAYSYRHRKALGRPAAELSRFATEAGLSGKYLALLWAALTESEAEAGPLAAIRKVWQELPAPTPPPQPPSPQRRGESQEVSSPLSVAGRGAGGEGSSSVARPGCERLRDLVVRLRRQLKPNVGKLQVKGISPGSQPFLLWSNRQQASQHRIYSGEVFSDLGKLAEQLKGADAELAKLFPTTRSDAASEKRLRG